MKNSGKQLGDPPLSHSTFRNRTFLLVGSLHHEHWPVSLSLALTPQLRMVSEVFLGLSLWCWVCITHGWYSFLLLLSSTVYGGQQVLCLAGVSVCGVDWLQVLDPIEWAG